MYTCMYKHVHVCIPTCTHVHTCIINACDNSRDALNSFLLILHLNTQIKLQTNTKLITHVHSSIEVTPTLTFGVDSRL